MKGLVYDANGKNQLRFVISPEGRVTEYRYNAQGLRTSSIEYASASYDTTGLTATGVPSEATMQAWATAQDQSRNTRADMAYDFRGQMQAVTTYGAVDATGSGVAATASTAHYVYDQVGRLVQTITPDGQGVTQSIYDGLGRVVSTNAHSADGTLSTTTVTPYDDAHGKTTVTLANGLTTTSAFDKAGRLVSVVQSSAATGKLGTTRYAYDADGRLLMTEGPTGQRSWMLYDAAGRKVADVDAAGALTEYVYNANNQVTETIQYDTAVDVTKLVDASGNPTTGSNPNPTWCAVTLASIRPAATSNDSRSWNLYDDAERLTWQVDALGYVTHTEYDGASRVLAVTRFATPIDTHQVDGGMNVDLLVGGFSTTTQLTEVVSGSGPNAPHVLTAVVTSKSGVHTADQLTGTVTFFAGKTLLGSAQVVAGVARLAASNLPAGADSITAVYSGDQDDLGSTSNALVDTVVAAPATTIALTAAPAAAAGASVEIRAAVKGQSPTGTVEFYDGGVPIGTASVVNGVAVLEVNSLAVGHHALTASYLGDANNAASSSCAVDQQINKTSSATAATVTTLRASNSQSAAGAPVTLTAVVSGANPTGTVTFYSGWICLGTAQVVNGLATLVVSNLPLGTNSLTASYSGDSSNAASASSTVGETILGSTTTSLSATATIGTSKPVLLTAYVFGATDSATSTVSFFNGATLIGSAKVQCGVASLTVASLAVAAGGLRAVYSGNEASSGSTSAAVNQIAPTLWGVGSTGPTPAGLALVTTGAVARNGTLSVRVSGSSPSGTVTFFDGAMNVLGTAQVVNGIATLSGADLPVGTVALAATYSGDSHNGTSVLQFTQTVAPATTLTSLTASPGNYAAQNAPVLLTAKVQGSDPTGTVTFYSGSTVVGVATLSDGYGAVTVNNLPAGVGQPDGGVLRRCEQRRQHVGGSDARGAGGSGLRDADERVTECRARR